MTVSQEAAYIKALNRAHEQGLEVVGKGVLTKDFMHFKKCETFYAVTSSDKQAASYLVFVRGLVLACTCLAKGYCKHRALTRQKIAQETTRAAVVTLKASQDAAAQDIARDLSIQASRVMGIHLFR